MMRSEKYWRHGKNNDTEREPESPKVQFKTLCRHFHRLLERQADYFNITRKNHAELCARMGEYPDVLLVFPLYADALPVGLLDFLKYLEANPPAVMPRISVLINCGFLEYQQNYLAVRISGCSASATDILSGQC